MKGSDTAFPIVTDVAICPGLSKLEWFAGMALMGIRAGEKEGFSYSSHEARCKAAFADAVAMLAESERRNK